MTHWSFFEKVVHARWVWGIVAALTVTALMGGGVLALNAGLYQQEAAKFASEHCKKKASGLIALNCYLYTKTQELSTALAEKGTAPKVTDANGRALGILIDAGNSSAEPAIYLPKANLIIRVSQYGDLQPITDFALTYLSDNCTGQPYFQEGMSTWEVYMHEGHLLMGDQSEPPHDIVGTFSVASGSDCNVAHTSGGTTKVVKAVPATLPFEFPVPGPLKLK